TTPDPPIVSNGSDEPEAVLDQKATETQLARVGEDWLVYREGVWGKTRRDEFKPLALSIQHETARKARNAIEILKHAEFANQTSGKEFRSFHFEQDGEIFLNCANCVLTKNGVIEHFRTQDGRVAVRETGDKIQILDQDHDSLALALERALERFGTYLHFDGNQAGARTLVDIVVTHDLRVTFTDDRLNAQIQLRRIQNDLDRGRSIPTSEQEQTAGQKRGAGASGSTPERKTAVQPDGKLASQHTGEVFVDCGSEPYDFDKKNDLNYFVRTITPQGEQRIYWGKDFPRALEEAGAKVGNSITATRVASKPVTVEEIQEQPDGSRQTVRIDAKRNSWQVDNHGVNREALIKAYDVLVKTPEDRKKLEISAPLLVAARDKAVVEQKRERLQQELASRSARQSNSLRI